MIQLSRLVADLASTLSGTLSHHGKPGVPRAAPFDVERYLGPWRVIAAIPLAPELGAFNPVESYARAADGSIDVQYQFQKGSFAAERETRKMVADIKPGTGDAEWGVRLLGPLHAQYVVAHVEDDYSAAIVARDARDHVWILARAATPPTETIERLRQMIFDMGYDEDKLVFFPQSHSAA